MEKIKWIEEYLDEAMKLACLEGHEPAIKLLDRLLFEKPGYSRLHYTLGIVYYRYADEVKLAENHFRVAINFDPLFADAYWYLGELLRQEERLDEAIEVCTKGLSAKRSNKSGLHSSVGQSYELKKKYRKAIRHYKEALSHSAELWDCKILEESIKRCRRKQR